MLNERIRANGDEEAIVGEITFGPFSSPLMKAIFKRFGKKAFGRSSACAEFESFLHAIADERSAEFVMKRVGKKPLGDCCLEIGTFHGITAIILSQFFDKVICVSVDEMPVMKREIVDYLGIKNIAFYDAKDNKDKAAFINAAKFDFCYQDGDHTHDTYSDFDLVKRCGRVLFHEFWPLQAPVWNLVNSLPQDEVIHAQFDCLAYWEKNPLPSGEGRVGEIGSING
jgi:hypothetical protein